MTTDPVGRAAHRAIDAYCLAQTPTPQLTRILVHDLLTLMAKRERCEVRLQIGDAPAFRRTVE